MVIKKEIKMNQDFYKYRNRYCRSYVSHFGTGAGDRMLQKRNCRCFSCLQRTSEGFEQWVIQIKEALAAFERKETGKKAAPFGVNLIVHPTNIKGKVRLGHLRKTQSTAGDHLFGCHCRSGQCGAWVWRFGLSRYNQKETCRKGIPGRS